MVSLDIRIAEHDDYDRIKSMWSCCFDDTAAFVDWYFGHIYRPENALCVWEKGALVSSLQILPRQLFVRGAFHPTGYVVGVMTLPQYRGRGYAGHMLQASAELMNQRDLFLSVLVSDVDPRFYRKFGWEPTHNITEMTMDAAGFRSALTMPHYPQPVQPADIPLLQSFYECYCNAGRHGYFLRDSGIWRNLLADLEMDGGQAYLIMNEDTDSPCGYVLQLGDDENEDECGGENENNELLKLKELVCFDSWDCSYHGDTQLMGASALPINPPTKSLTKPFLMTRIINLRGLLENCIVPQASHDHDHDNDRNQDHVRHGGPPLSFDVALNAPELMSVSANTWAALILGAADNELYQATMQRLGNPLRDRIARLFPAADNYACELF